MIADYKGETADQLSVKSGETILVISKKEGGWSRSDKRILISYDCTEILHLYVLYRNI